MHPACAPGWERIPGRASQDASEKPVAGRSPPRRKPHYPRGRIMEARILSSMAQETCLHTAMPSKEGAMRTATLLDLARPCGVHPYS